jgi:drug/metabolite transporter (DMT)-like permease
MYYAAAHLPAGILAIIVNTVPIIAYPMALLAHLEQFNLQRLLGIVLAVFALMLISIPKSSLPDETMAPWVLMTLITPISFAACSIIIAKFRPANSHTLELTAGMLIMSSMILAPIVYLTGNYYHFSLPLTLPDQIILLEILLSSIGYVLFFQLIKIAGPVYYSMVDTIVVITGITWGYVLFNETLNRWTGSAVVFIILALWLVTTKQKPLSENESHA